MPVNCVDLRFAKVRHIGKSNVIRRLEIGLKFFYEWSLLGIGGWVAIKKDTASPLGGDASQLRLENCPGYDDGQVWGGFRKHWVYESGVSYTDVDGGIHSPSGVEVYVNSILQPTGYNVNYELGQIVFDSAISTTDTVQAQHSFKMVQVYIGDDLPWWQELQFQSWNVDDSHFQQTDRGDWFVGSNHRVQMPIIIIDATGRGTNPPFALGNCKIKRDQVVFFHVITEDKCTRNNLMDLIIEQAGKSIILLDIDQAAANLDLPLDCNGRLIGKMYPDLVLNPPNGYCWAKAFGDNPDTCNVNTLNCGLHQGTVKMDYSVVFSIL